MESMMAFRTGNLDVAIKPDRLNSGNNSDKFHVIITNMAGQSILINGEEVDKLEFTIVGNWEINDFIHDVAVHDHFLLGEDND
jgi:hypothetical protein